jgi:hypothetical protein
MVDAGLPGSVFEQVAIAAQVQLRGGVGDLPDIQPGRAKNTVRITAALADETKHAGCRDRRDPRLYIHPTAFQELLFTGKQV